MADTKETSANSVKVESKDGKIIITAPVQQVLEGDKGKDIKAAKFCECEHVIGAVGSFI